MPKDFRYRPRSASRVRPALMSAVGLLAVIALLFAFDRITGGVISSAAQSGAGIMRGMAASAGLSIRESGAFRTRAALERENGELRREIALYAEEIAQAEFIRAENDELRAMVHLAQDAPGVSARIISSHRASPYGTFLIDAGTDDGVAEGAIVLTPGGYVLGEVVLASGNSARVLSAFAPEADIDLVAGGQAFTAVGAGGGNATAEVAREIAPAVGTPVVAPGLGGRNAGTVMHVESASSSATALISIRIPVNLDTLRFVYVVPR